MSDAQAFANALTSRGTVANPYGLPQTIQVSRVRRSESTAKLDEALAKAILGFGEVLKENENPFFKSKYADLSAVLAATRKQLAQHGISLRQWPFTEEGKAGITSRLCCQGEWEEADFVLPLTGKQDAQAVGSAITYARRYATQSILAIAAETDDDANSAVVQKTKEAEKRFDERDAAQRRISPTQVKAFWKAVRERGKTENQVRAYLAEIGPYVQTEEIKQGEFNEAVRWASSPVPVPPDLLQGLNQSLDMVNAAKRTVGPRMPIRTSEPLDEGPAHQIETPKKPVDPFWKSFWVMAKRNNVSEADIHQYAKENLGMDKSLTELDPKKLAVLANWVSLVQP